MLKTLLTTAISGGDCSPDTIARYLATITARDRFLRGEIPFEDYLDILEWAGVEMDNLLDDWEESLIVMGV